MRINRRFRIEEHPEYGTVGLTPLWMPGHQHDPLTGMGVAHDLLEHGPDDVCEWQGLGGSVYVRGEDYYHQRVGNPDAAENIGSEFRNLFYLWEGADIPDPGRTLPLRDEWAEELIQNAVQGGCKGLRDEESENRDVTHWTRSENRQRMIGWMRRGYRAAKRRYRRINRFRLLEAFCSIERVADETLKHYADYLGSEVRLTCDIETARTIIAVEGEDY